MTPSETIKHPQEPVTEIDLGILRLQIEDWEKGRIQPHTQSAIYQAAKAYLSRPVQTPRDWVCVPREPTDEIMNKFYGNIPPTDQLEINDWQNGYRAMFENAAPAIDKQKTLAVDAVFKNGSNISEPINASDYGLDCFEADQSIVADMIYENDDNQSAPTDGETGVPYTPTHIDRGTGIKTYGAENDSFVTGSVRPDGEMEAAHIALVRLRNNWPKIIQIGMFHDDIDVLELALTNKSPSPKDGQALGLAIEALEFYSGGLHYTEFFDNCGGGKMSIINDRGEVAETALSAIILEKGE